VRKALAKPEVRERISQFAAEVTPSTPEQLADFVKAQLASGEFCGTQVTLRSGSAFTLAH